MKNTIKIRGIIIFFIILSLFCFGECFAASVSDQSSMSETIKSDTDYSFTCNQTGVYLVEMRNADGQYTEDWTLTCGGGDVRLAAIAQQDNDGKTYYDVILDLKSYVYSV